MRISSLHRLKRYCKKEIALKAILHRNILPESN